MNTAPIKKRWRKRTNVVIYEDNLTLQETLEMVINDLPRFKVVGKFSNCNHLAASMQQLLPDLVIMDIEMEGTSAGIEGVSYIKSKYPQTRVIMYTVFEDSDNLFYSLCAGADGYLLKSTPAEDLVKYLKPGSHSDHPMSPGIAHRILELFRQQKVQPLPPALLALNLTPEPKARKAKRIAEKLSKEDIEILQLLADGYIYKAIGEKMNMKLETVKNKLSNIYRKLQVANSNNAIAVAMRNRLIK